MITALLQHCSTNNDVTTCAIFSYVNLHVVSIFNDFSGFHNNFDNVHNNFGTIQVHSNPERILKPVYSM